MRDSLLQFVVDGMKSASASTAGSSRSPTGAV